MFYFGYLFNSPELRVSFLLLCNKLLQTYQQPKIAPTYLTLSVGQKSGHGIDGFSAQVSQAGIKVLAKAEVSHLELTSYSKLIQVARRIEFLVPVNVPLSFQRPPFFLGSSQHGYLLSSSRAAGDCVSNTIPFFGKWHT